MIAGNEMVKKYTVLCVGKGNDERGQRAVVAERFHQTKQFRVYFANRHVSIVTFFYFSKQNIALLFH